MEQRQSFTFWRSFADVLENLDNDEQRWQLMAAIINYSLDEVEPKLSGIMNAVWFGIKPIIDKGRVRQQVGSKGGRPRSQVGFFGCEENQTETKPKPNKNQTETKAEANGNLTETKCEPNENPRYNIQDTIYKIQDTENKKQDTSVCENSARTQHQSKSIPIMPTITRDPATRLYIPQDKYEEDMYVRFPHLAEWDEPITHKQAAWLFEEYELEDVRETLDYMNNNKQLRFTHHSVFGYAKSNLEQKYKKAGKMTTSQRKEFMNDKII